MTLLNMDFTEGKITLFELFDGKIKNKTIASSKDFEDVVPIWIDILGASEAERIFISEYFDVDLPDPSELTDLEASERFYMEEKDEIHLHSNFLLNVDKATSVPVGFIVKSDILFTIRDEDLPAFRVQRLRVRYQQIQIQNCKDLLIDLYDADVEYSSSTMEEIYTKLRKVSQDVLKETASTVAANILANITENEEINGLIRGNLLDTQRAITFLMRGKFLNPTQLEEAREILSDIDSLNTHTSFISDKISFLMDATVGFVSVSQNRNISQLTIINIVFMPINVIAGVGGMSEFSMMTKDVADWPVAYGLLLLGMGIIGAATYYVLKRLQKK